MFGDFYTKKRLVTLHQSAATWYLKEDVIFRTMVL
jgi:hypothetical protein